MDRAINPKRYVSVDSQNGTSADLVKLTNPENQFTGNFFVKDGNTTKDINNVFVKGVQVEGESSPRLPQNGIVTIPAIGQVVPVDEGIQNVSLVGYGDSRIDGEVKDTDAGKIVEIKIEELGCEEIAVDRLYVGGVPISKIVPDMSKLKSLPETLPSSGTTLNQTIEKLNELIGILKEIADNQTYVTSDQESSQGEQH